MTLPAFAGDRDISTRDLQGIPRHHKYLISLLGGTAVGAGIGALLPGGGNSILKGALVGGGGMGAIYLNSHRNAAGAWSDWAHIGTNTALGTGIGWTICDCNDGALAGALVGGGGTAVWRAMHPDRNPTTASNTRP